MRVLLVFLLLLSCLFSYSQKISTAAIDSLLRRSRETHSDALIVMQNGQPVIEEYFGNKPAPIYIASISKALSGIAILKLLNDGRISSIDQRVMDFYPEWNQGQKKNITLRMLLNHTSGLQNVRQANLELEPKGEVPDIIKLALAAEIEHAPGTVYSYNNKATALLGGIIAKASGKRMDHYFETEFFQPMGIRNVEWLRDQAGNPKAFGGFRMPAKELALFGELMAGKGTLNGKRYFDERWVDSATTPTTLLNTEMGLLWTLIPKTVTWVLDDSTRIRTLEGLDLPENIRQGFRSLYGKPIAPFAFYREMGNLFGVRINRQPQMDSLVKATGIDLPGLFRKVPSKELLAYMHSGTGGQWLLILPEHHIVAIRLVHRDEDYKEETDLFSDFRRRITDLVK